MFQSPHIRLLVSDFPACFRFYRDVLDFTPSFGSEDEVYADFEAGGQGIALFQRELMAEAVGTSGSAGTQDAVMLILATADVDAAAVTLREKGVVLVSEPEDRPDWGIRTAHFRDPEGRLIEINCPLSD